MANPRLSKLELVHKNLSLENSVLQKKLSLVGKTRENGFSDFASGLIGSSNTGFGQSPLTSFNPSLQNNIYAPLTLMWTNLMYLYKTHGLLQTAIDMPVLDAVRGGLEISSDQMDPDDISELEDWLEENGVIERIVDAFIWARLFGGGALIVNTASDPREPLGDELLDGPLEFYDANRWELSCERRIPASGHYGFYGKTLDASRVITILGKRAPWLIRAQLADWGMSEFERMIEDFNIFLRTRNVIYELLEEAKVDVYMLKGFTGQLASSTGTNLTQRRIQTMNQVKNFNNALIMDKEDSYDWKQMNFGGLSDVMKENRMGIASALRMPMSKLFGIPAAGLTSGEDDIENYNGLVESEVRQPMKQVIRKVLKLAVKHLFKDELDISFKFRPLRSLTAVEEENIKTSKSNRYLTLYDRSLMSSKEIGEAMQKDNLVPIPLEAEKGLLDEHPAPPTAIGTAGDLIPEATPEALGDEPEKIPENPPKVTHETPNPGKAPAAPKPKMNTLINEGEQI